MNKVQIITDSCSDLTTGLMKEYGIDYCMMRTVFEGVEKPADLAWTPEDVHKFYDTIRGGKRITTTQVPVEEFQRVYEKYLKEGCDIVYIGCSGKQSGSVNTSAVLAKKLKEQYPDQTVYSIDSLNACLGEGMLAIEAAKLAQNGNSAEEINDIILEKRKDVNEYVTVHSLDSLRRAGRVKGSAAFFGNLMGVKPIIIADANGEQAAFKKSKGRLGSFKEIVNLMKESIIKPEEQTLYLVHADCKDEEIEQLKAMIREQIPVKDIHTSYIGPIIGASIGPDAVGIFAYGKKVTFRTGE
jgi:DegV family protein with EDD domain